MCSKHNHFGTFHNLAVNILVLIVQRDDGAHGTTHVGNDSGGAGTGFLPTGGEQRPRGSFRSRGGRSRSHRAAHMNVLSGLYTLTKGDIFTRRIS